MRARIYLRLAKDRAARANWRVDAALNPNPRPLTTPSGNALHTVNFALDIDMPDDLFQPQEWPTIAIELEPEAVHRVPDEVMPVIEP